MSRVPGRVGQRRLSRFTLCPRQCRKLALEDYGERLHLTLQIEEWCCSRPHSQSAASQLLQKHLPASADFLPARRSESASRTSRFDHAVKIPSRRVVRRSSLALAWRGKYLWPRWLLRF